MAGRMASRYFVDVGGHLLTKGVWRIDGALTFKEGLDVTTRDQLLGKGRLSLVNAIVREGVRGRSLGATAVQVHMDVDGRLSDFELGFVPARVALPR